MIDKYDIAIVGAGPAGSSAAIRLASAGRKVVLFEKMRFPRAKLCGEFVSPECLAHFDELGVASGIRSAEPHDIEKTVFYSRSGRFIEIDSEWFGSRSMSAIGLSRAELDHQLLLRAREVGVDVREGTAVTGPVVRGKRIVGVRVRSADGEYEIAADITLDATGRARVVAKSVDKVRERKPDHVAFKAHLRGAAIESGACEIFAYPGGYGGCNAVENGLFNLCFIASAKDVRRFASEPERVMKGVVFKNKRAADALRDAAVASDWLAVPITRFGRHELVPADGMLTVGDAASFIDPFTGSGILMALEGSRIAANVIIQNADKPFQNAAAEYGRAYRAAFDRRLTIASILRRAAYIPAFADAAIGVLSLSSFLRRRVARATRGEAEKIDSLRA